MIVPCVINTLQDLIDCLQKAVEGSPGAQYLRFGANLFPDAGAIVNYLALNPAELRIDQVNGEPLVRPSATDVKVVGRASLFVPSTGAGVAYDVTITGTVPSANTVRLVLTGVPADAANWTFAKNFVTLPQYLGYKKPGLEWMASFFDDITVTSPKVAVANYSDASIATGLSLAGTLDTTKGVLASLGRYFVEPQLPLSGTIVMRAGGVFPLIDLHAIIGELAQQRLTALKLRLQTRVPPASERDESYISIVGQVALSSFGTFVLEAPVLRGDFAWAFTITIVDPEKYTLAAGLKALTEFVGGQTLTLPAGLDNLASLYLASVTVTMDLTSGTPKILSLGARIQAAKPWVVPITGISIIDVYVEWQVTDPFGTPALLGEVGGTLKFGEAEDAPRVIIEASIDGGPQFETTLGLVANLDPRYPLKIARVFEHFTGLQLGFDLSVTNFQLNANTGTRTFSVFATLAGPWPLPVPKVTFRELTFMMAYAPNSLTGSVVAHIDIVSLPFIVQAAYRGADAGWKFSGSLTQSAEEHTLQRFVDNLSSGQWPQLPTTLANIELRNLSFAFDTKSKDFEFDTTFGWHYVMETLAEAAARRPRPVALLAPDNRLLTRDELLALEWDIEAELSLKATRKTPEAEAVYSGFVRGQISINALIVRVLYAFDVGNSSTLTFQLEFRGVTLTATLRRNKKQEQILSLSLGGVTFGQIVEFLVNLVDPNLGFRLEAPWSVLNEIKFDNLSLTINLVTKEVGVEYKVDRDLGIAYIDTIGLAYVDKAGRKTVDITITGRFADQEYKSDDPLKWDLLNDPPPKPAGPASKVIDLRYLGIGQNVGFRSARNFKSVKDVIDTMTADFLPPPGGTAQDQNPLLSPTLQKLAFTGNSHWLIGADLTVIGAISVAAIFNDPTLYGIRIGLSGEKVKAFSGLQFEILYKKVTDTVGVYHIELTLPDSMRQLQFGAVAVTLPIVTIDIYTNGNFRLDFGFPVNQDFSRSFCVQAGPFIGYGGFYFALLDGATSDRVPRITNGTFSPVIEFGLGLSVGVGRTIDKGVLKAGATLTVQAIVEGVFGWFNPRDNSSPSALYYRIQGTAAIVGKLYGAIDFVIIKAEFSVVATASVMLTIEAHEPILVQLVVSVEVTASVKIVFIRIHFSFTAKIDLSFTIGSKTQSPWIREQTQSQFLLRQQRTLVKRRAPGDTLFAALMTAAGPGTFDWTARAVFPQTLDVMLSLVPTLTIAATSRVFASVSRLAAQGDAAADVPERQVVMALFAPNSVAASARTARDMRRLEMSVQAAADTPFNRLAIGMLRWALSSYTRGDIGPNPPPPPIDFVLADDLAEIGKFLADRERVRQTFTYDRLTGFIEKNYTLRIRAAATAAGLVHPLGAPLDAAAPEVPSTVFPMVPHLAMTPKNQPTVSFWKHGCITEAYERSLDEYYGQLRTKSGDTEIDGPRGAIALPSSERFAAGLTGCAPNTESLSSFIFRDYFSMLVKGAVQNAAALLKAYPYEPTGATGATGETLERIALQFSAGKLEYETRPGDTIGRIAAHLGVPIATVEAAHPRLLGASAHARLPVGLVLRVAAGPSPVAIAHANPNYPLQGPAGVRPVFMPIEGVLHQVKMAGAASETLNTIAGRYGITHPATIFSFTDRNGGNPNVVSTDLWQTGGPFVIPARDHTVPDAMDSSQALVAAFFFVRNLGPAQPSNQPWYGYVQWYQQWIVDHNDLAQPVWKVPVVRLQPDGSLRFESETTYRVQGSAQLAPDTPDLVAGYFALVQLRPAIYAAAFQQFMSGVTNAGGLTWRIPSYTHALRAGESLGTIAQAVGILPPDLIPANAARGGVLRPLAVLSLPPLTYAIKWGDTLASVAQQFDLTVEELALSVQNADGILSPFGPTETGFLTIPDVPGRNTTTLINDLVKGGSFNDTSGMLSRFLLHGLRVPRPDGAMAPGADAAPPSGPVGAAGLPTAGLPAAWPPETQLWGLYEMVGQQFPLPAGITSTNVVFEKGATANWLCLDTSVGPTAQKNCVEEFQAVLGPSFLYEYSPGPTLSPEIVYGPTGLPLYRETPQRHAFEQGVHWQASTDVSLPGPTALGGQPSIWAFPPTLQDLVNGITGPTASTPPYELQTAMVGDPTDANDRALTRYAWATAIDVRLQRAPAESGAGSNSYLVVGADQTGRDLLLKAWRYLRVTPSALTSLFLLYRPSATSDNSQGLGSDPVDAVKTFVLKTNLSTVTHSNVFAAAPDAVDAQAGAGAFYARFDSAGAFLQLLWEASITGTGGFYLHYWNANGGAGLPADLFANSDTADVRLVMLLSRQAHPTNPDRRLLPFNNCAVLAENLDPSVSGLYARLHQPTPDDLQRVATVAAGHVGFFLTRRNPEWAMGADANAPAAALALQGLPPEDQTGALYNLVGYRVRNNNDFALSNEGLPIGPMDNEVEGVTGPTGPAYWRYQQVVPVYPLGTVNDTPDSSALPPRADNPYRGITGPQGPTAKPGERPLSQAIIDLQLHDIYGNQMVATPPPGAVSVPVGYTDEVIGLSSWPGIGTDFLFTPQGATGVALDMQCSLHATRYVAAGGYTNDQARATLDADAARYRQIFYQVQQRDLTTTLETNVGTALIAPDALKAPLTAFASKAHVFIAAAGLLEPQTHKTIEGDRLKTVAATYSVTVARLAEANDDLPVAKWLRGSIVRPYLTVAAAMNTLDALVKNQPSTPFPPVCGMEAPQGMSARAADARPRVQGMRFARFDDRDDQARDEAALTTTATTAGAGSGAQAGQSSPDDQAAASLTPEELAKNNINAPLTPGIVLRTKPRTTALAAGIRTLDDAATQLASVVYAIATNPDNGQPIDVGLFADNLTRPSVVTPNLTIEIGAVTVTTDDTSTFQSVLDGFASLGWRTGDLVARLAEVKDFLRANVDIVHATFVVPQPVADQPPTFSLASMPSGTGDAAELAKTNRVVPNFYDAGTQIYLRYECYAPQPFDTLGTLSAEFHVALPTLAAFNADAALLANVTLAIPNLVALPDSTAGFAPCSPTSSDAFEMIAARFETTVPALATINANVPGIFGGAEIRIGGKPPVTPAPMASLQSVADQLGMPLNTFVDNIKSVRGLLRQNGVVITPLPRVPRESGGSPSLEDIAQRFNVTSATTTVANVMPWTAAPLLEANRPVRGFLREGADIAGPSGVQPLKVGRFDTVDTIIRRFKDERGRDVTIADLLGANAKTPNLLTAGQRFLLPPNPTVVTSGVTARIPPPGNGCEANIVFPVRVDVRFVRARGLVSPAFMDTEAVYESVSGITPRGWQEGSTTLSLAGFAQSFEAAFATERLKCAVSRAQSVSDPRQPGQLWAVNFGSAGVRTFDLMANQPQFYALAPLSTELLTRTVWVRNYKSGCGLCEWVNKRFEAVDLDAWMLQFLSTVDLFLSTDYAVPAFQMDNVARATVAADGPRAPVDPAGAPGVVGASGCTGCTGSTGLNGPANFDSIVQAKQQIAQLLKQSVVPVLMKAGPTEGYYAAQASEALYQQMLVRLADAYQVDAIVQYPVNVQSPCVTPPGATGQHPPRVSGTLAPDFYIVPGENPGTLKDVATASGVSTPFLAETIARAQGVLKTGAKAQYNAASYEISANDTLAIVARAFNVDPDPAAPGYWETWTTFINAIETQPLIDAGASIPATRVAREADRYDTLAVIADYVGVDAGTIGQANQDRSDVFEPNREIAIKDYPKYSTRAGDSLVRIVAAINAGPRNPGVPALTVGVLAAKVADQYPLLRLGGTFACTQTPPDVTLSTSKVSLGRVDTLTGLPPAISTLFTVKHPRRYKRLFLNLRYVITEAEHGIADVPGVTDYLASSWLTFILPIGSGRGTDVGVKTAIPQVQVPIPLRFYPTPPTLIGQSGLATPMPQPLPVTPEERILRGRHWDFRMDFSGGQAAQDTNYVEVTFNAAGQIDTLLRGARTEALFAALAEFSDAYPRLIQDLALLPSLGPGAVDDRASGAIRTLDTLAVQVAHALATAPHAALGAAQWPEETYRYKVQTSINNDALDELKLGWETGPTGMALRWPDVFVQSLTAPTAGVGPDAGFLPMTRVNESQEIARYAYPPNFPADARITQRFRFPTRDVIRNQNAWAGIYLTRNEDLIASGPLGLTGATGGFPTSPAFRYRTPLVRFIDRLTPLVSRDETIDVAGLTGPLPLPNPRPLSQHIENMLDNVLEIGPRSPISADAFIGLVCRYGFPMNEGAGDGELIASAPVRLVPTQLMTEAFVKPFARDLSNSLRAWRNAEGPTGQVGALIFDLSVYTIPPGATEGVSVLKPTLRFEDLRVPLNAIAWGVTETEKDEKEEPEA